MAKETKRPPTEAGTVTGYDWSKTGVTGLEATRQEDLGIPFLQILQDLSPQIKKSDPNYAAKRIEGAQPGDVINSLANIIVHRQGGEPLAVIPCYHERMYVEWRANRGGFVKAHRNATILSECTRNSDNEDVLRNGNVIMTTSYFYLIAMMGEERLHCVLGMTSASLKEARTWLNLITGIRMEGPNGKFMPPMFSHVYHLKTQLKVKDRNAWYAWDISMKGQLQDMNLIPECINMAKTSAAAQRQALPPAVDTASSSTSDDNVPFQ